MRTVVHKTTTTLTARQMDNYYFGFQLYLLAKATANSRKMPLLPLKDKRRMVLVASQANRQPVSLKQLISHQLHAFAAPLFKKSAA